MPGETPLPQADTPEDDHDMYLPASHAWQIGFQMAFFGALPPFRRVHREGYLQRLRDTIEPLILKVDTRRTPPDEPLVPHG